MMKHEKIAIAQELAGFPRPTEGDMEEFEAFLKEHPPERMMTAFEVGQRFEEWKMKRNSSLVPEEVLAAQTTLEIIQDNGDGQPMVIRIDNVVSFKEIVPEVTFEQALTAKVQGPRY